jgi:hypothetical protein
MRAREAKKTAGAREAKKAVGKAKSPSGPQKTGGTLKTAAGNRQNRFLRFSGLRDGEGERRLRSRRAIPRQ